MKTIEFSRDLDKKLKLLAKKNYKLYRKVEKQLILFQSDPSHSSLRIHKLKGNLKDVWSLSVDRNYRMVFMEDGFSIYFFDIGTHSEIYN